MGLSFPRYNPQHPIAVQIPAALSAYNFENAAFTLTDASAGPASAACSLTPEQIFNGYSTALSAPGATYYVNFSSGNDTNAGGSSAPFQTINKAIQAANSGGVAAKIMVAPGIYPRSYGGTNSGGPNGLSPTVDMAFVVNGYGRVTVGTFDTGSGYAAFSKNGTYTNTYSASRTHCDRVYDLLNLDRFGCYVQLTYVASAAICNLTPGSWYTDGTNLYVNRADGAAPTATNTRYVLDTIQAWVNANNKNIYIGDGAGGATNGGFDTEGGYLGGFYSNASAVGGTKFVQVFVGARFRYAGGLNTGNNDKGRGVAMDSQYGAAWFFGCDASCNATDGFNFHNSLTSTLCVNVTVNCTAFNNGISPAQSCNGWTSHETVIGADFAGCYENNHGGSCRSIGNSISLLAGTYVKNDRGDILFGGAILPTAFQADNSAVYYCFRAKADMPGGTVAYNAATAATSQILQRQCWPSRGSSGGAGVIGTY